MPLVVFFSVTLEMDAERCFTLPSQGSVSEVEALQRKHALFENSLEAQMEQVAEVDRYAQQLIQAQHYDSDDIKRKIKAILLRYAVSQENPLKQDMSWNYISYQSHILKWHIKYTYM